MRRYRDELNATIGSRTFDFDSRDGRICVNIKYHENIEAPDKVTQKKLDYIVEHDEKGEDRRYRLQNFTFEICQESWWEERVETAKRDGVGNIHSDGKSGGYLVLKEWRVEKVAEMLAELAEACVNCGEHWPDHIEGKCRCKSCNQTHEYHVALGKCLFDSGVYSNLGGTEFQREHGDSGEDLSSQWTDICNIDTFLESCKITPATKDWVDEEFGNRVNEAYDELKQEEKDNVDRQERSQEVDQRYRLA